MASGEKLFKHTIGFLKECIPNLEIKPISDVKDKGFEERYELIESLATTGKMGQAVDILKIVLLKNFGGIFLDLNFLLKAKKLETTMVHYNFLLNLREEIMVGMFTMDLLLLRHNTLF